MKFVAKTKAIRDNMESLELLLISLGTGVIFGLILGLLSASLFVLYH